MELKQQRCRKCDIMNIFGAEGTNSIPSRPPSVSDCIIKDGYPTKMNLRNPRKDMKFCFNFGSHIIHLLHGYHM